MDRKTAWETALRLSQTVLTLSRGGRVLPNIAIELAEALGHIEVWEARGGTILWVDRPSGPLAGVQLVELLNTALRAANAPPDAVLAALFYCIERTARASGYSLVQVAELLAETWKRGEALGGAKSSS